MTESTERVSCLWRLVRGALRTLAALLVLFFIFIVVYTVYFIWPRSLPERSAPDRVLVLGRITVDWERYEYKSYGGLSVTSFELIRVTGYDEPTRETLLVKPNIAGYYAVANEPRDARYSFGRVNISYGMYHLKPGQIPFALSYCQQSMHEDPVDLAARPCDEKDGRPRYAAKSTDRRLDTDDWRGGFYGDGSPPPSDFEFRNDYDISILGHVIIEVEGKGSIRCKLLKQGFLMTEKASGRSSVTGGRIKPPIHMNFLSPKWALGWRLGSWRPLVEEDLDRQRRCSRYVEERKAKSKRAEQLHDQGKASLEQGRKEAAHGFFLEALMTSPDEQYARSLAATVETTGVHEETLNHLIDGTRSAADPESRFRVNRALYWYWRGLRLSGSACLRASLAAETLDGPSVCDIESCKALVHALVDGRPCIASRNDLGELLVSLIAFGHHAIDDDMDRYLHAFPNDKGVRDLLAAEPAAGRTVARKTNVDGGGE